MNVGALVPFGVAALPQGQGPASSENAFAQLEWPGDVRDLPTAAATGLWVAGSVVAMAVAVGCAFAMRRRRVLVEASSSPAATASRRLQALVVAAAGAPFGPFYLELKAVLRVHAQERFDVRAAVATSEELRQRLPVDDDLDAALAACDQVLFARAPADIEAHHAAVAHAECWLRSTGVAT
jgi:hypothetical protein